MNILFLTKFQLHHSSILQNAKPVTGQAFSRIDQLHVVGIYHFLKAQNFPEFLGYMI